MNGIHSGVKVLKPEEMSAKEDWLSIVKGFEREEVDELLSQTFCGHCERLLHDRVLSIANRKRAKRLSISSVDATQSDDISDGCLESCIQVSLNNNGSFKSPGNIHSGSPKSYVDKISPALMDYKRVTSLSLSRSGTSLDNGMHENENSPRENELRSEEQKEKLRFLNVGRKTNFTHFERVNGKNINVVQGLELHTHVFNDEEQKKIVESVYEFQRMGQKGRLRERTYTEPSKWMRGKGRITIQFGCCYNYAVDKNGNPPGIIRDEEVDPLPPVFIDMIKRLVRWHVLPPTCVPNSCIVNIYEEGDCIPPHIDHHDFLRPFCTISFLTQCNILFGSNLKIISPGEFAGPFSIPLPIGSVLVLKGNGADVAKHCVPAVPAKRISITFRKMNESKIPYSYSPDPELRGVLPLTITPLKSQSQQKEINTKETSHVSVPVNVVSKQSKPSLFNGEDDFPPLGAAVGSRHSGHKKNVSKA
ncbi:putative oxoglutarate/iron-dependent dioxygenase, alpha-ketoglutarate-dependent dioxygenase AlkB [Helianthus debilis subsp. tardiflorus]